MTSPVVFRRRPVDLTPVRTSLARKVLLAAAIYIACLAAGIVLADLTGRPLHAVADQETIQIG